MYKNLQINCKIKDVDFDTTPQHIVEFNWYEDELIEINF